MTRGRFLIAGGVLATACGIVLVATTGNGADAGLRFAVTTLPTVLPFVLGTAAPRGRRMLWWVLAALVIAGWTGAVIGLRAANGDPNFAGLYGWAACVIASIGAIGASAVGLVRNQFRGRSRQQ
ncbi:hypothetical protein SAMN05216382_1621 [Sphingomonas palmae]|uniref:Uncharacterized protein n=1 Tax=Sphingomonas palmae TaxID=1855283 RepID=A0A1H7NMB1_9SPHN|nr:hypothetical protein [Sphingomonas palmae]SEL24047.1 hypothetical protein SAMN05216382_1621 [Sphingomonas palmae]